VLNTGILAPPNEKGKQELIDALERSKKAAGNLTMDAVRARMAWLMAEPEKTLTDEVVAIRYAIYAQPGMQQHMGKIAVSTLGRVVDDAWTAQWMRPDLMKDIRCPTLVLWTRPQPRPAGGTGRGRHAPHPGRAPGGAGRKRALAAVGGAGAVQPAASGVFCGGEHLPRRVAAGCARPCHRDAKMHAVATSPRGPSP